MSRLARLVRLAAELALGASILSLSPAEDVRAAEADLAEKDCAFTKGLGNGECQHFLRNPAGVTDDPCWCDKCRNGVAGQRHDGHTVPPGWNPQLFETGGMDAYLKRHSVAWGITCSECFQSEKPWPNGSSDKEPGTPPLKDWAGRSSRDTVLARLRAESRFFREPRDVVVAYNRHFYLVTDIGGLKARMPSGSSRVVSRHEWTHLMIERAEYARREFTRTLGPLMTESQDPRVKDPIPQWPVAMIFTQRVRDYTNLASTYFAGPLNKGLRGTGNAAKMCGDMCLSGIGGTLEKVGSDHELIVWMRNRLAHNWVCDWGSWQTRPKSLPCWIDEGVSHWLTKALEKFRDDAVYSTGEGALTADAPEWSEKDWDKDVARWAVMPGRLGPIEELLGKTVMTDMTEEDVKRSWSYCALGFAEWREPFVKMLRALRQEKDVREAFVTNLGITPEQFDQRWRERVTGKRKSLAPQPGDDDASGEGAGAEDRRAIRGESDPKVLAARVRSLGEIKDAKTIPVVVDVMGQNRDLPRETALVTLLRTKDPKCIEALWRYGLEHPDGIVRAYTAKICGRLKITAALPRLEEQMEDKGSWYARAEAAVACGMMQHAKSMAAMRKMLISDPSEKAQVGAIDALSMFKEGAAIAVPVIAKQLKSAQWQLRIAATQALGEIGSMEAVEPLIARMEEETGRLPDEIYSALKKITRDDLGRKASSWRTWWDREVANNNGRIPGRPAPKDQPKEGTKPKGPDPNDPRATRDSGPPAYFGLEIYSSRVGFVIDTSESMLRLFTPDPSAAAALSREYVGRDKLTICKQEVEQALRALDPRAHFNIISFGTQIKSFEQNPVPASRSNIDRAAAHLMSLPGAGETNYYDALKAALDIGANPDTNENFKATPDTITFLTDGEPTKGDILDADTILEWYTGLNRYARVKTHTITFGLVGVDTPLLRGMAERNGGRFTLVPEYKKKTGQK